MKQWQRWLMVGTLMSMSIIGFFGCGLQFNDHDKDVLKVGAIGFASTLEPTENYFSWVVVRYGIGETLVKFNDTMGTEPWIALKWSVGDDNQTWTFTINDKVTFSNGRKVTAQAVKESLERTFEKSQRAKTFFNYDRIEANGQTLIIHTDKVYPNLPGLLGDPLFLIVDVQSEREGRNFAVDGPIGTGPYVATSFTKERAELEANKHYWDGTVPFKRVEVPAINDANTRAMALQSGDVDMAINIGPGEYDLFKDNKDYVFEESSSLRDVMVRMSQNGALADANIRAALIAGIDRESYAKTLLKDTFIAGKAPLPPSLGYGFKQVKASNQYSPENARKLLAQSGWVDTDGDGYVDKDGQDLVLDFYTYTSRPELNLYAEAMQADYKKIGIGINIKIVDYSVIDELAKSGAYDLMISSVVTANTGNPVWFLKQYWGSNIDGANPNNGSGYSNPRYDELLALAGSTMDSTTAHNAIISAQQILLDDNAAIYLGYPKINLVGKNYMKGIHTSPCEYYIITKDLKKE
ncbi:ABC transporter substrate-binding protein [Veillonella caviae]|uniref:ABC transporter substrate-binding protein n=1 Tax=Veillonella caviae TaxID=248316 RepID=UPI000F8E2530|nr:ABC transporter substrate-binding protein [Veillonella caviae]